jgi:fermentation-respiration switch protein FrsA (DUF1100 family)
MKKQLGIALIIVGIRGFVVSVGIIILTRLAGLGLVTHPLWARRPIAQYPSNYGMDYEEVTVKSADAYQYTLHGWFIPADPENRNGAVVMIQHGYKVDRTDALLDAQKLHRSGYAVLVTSIRSHDLNEGEVISFGKHEMKDLQAWYNYLLERDDVDLDKIGILGISMGGMLSIQYAAENPNIKAVVTHSAPSSLDDTVGTSVPYFTKLPAFPLVDIIVFWGERKGDFETSDIDATVWIQEISPRPVLLMQGGSDVAVSPESGHRLYEAANGPKLLWYEPALDHTQHDEAYPELYEERVCSFYDCYLLNDRTACTRLSAYQWEGIAQQP